MPLQQISQTNEPAIKAENTSTGAGLSANSKSGAAIIGQSIDGRGVLGESTDAQGVWGVSHAKFHAGVTGVNDNHDQEAGPGVFGTSKGTGIWGESETWMGVFGKTKSNTGGAGVHGLSEQRGGVGVYGLSNLGTGVLGKSKSGIGVMSKSDTSEAIHAETKSQITAAIAAYNTNPDGTGAAIYAKKEGKGVAGFFEGNLYVTGNITAKGDLMLEGADLAENFITSETNIEPGVVMSLTESGELRRSVSSYDKKVAGVVSGAGLYRPAIILDKKEDVTNQCTIAMIGKVCVNVCDINGPINVGDLLTTSDIAGIAMKATDPVKSFGAIIGKALKPLRSGKGLVPILISLQ